MSFVSLVRLRSAIRKFHHRKFHHHLTFVTILIIGIGPYTVHFLAPKVAMRKAAKSASNEGRYFRNFMVVQFHETEKLPRGLEV